MSDNCYAPRPIEPPPAPFRYRPQELRRGDWTARYFAGGVGVNLCCRYLEDPACARFEGTLYFDFDAAGEVSEGYGYSRGGKTSRRLAFRRTRKTERYFAQARAERAALLAEPEREAQVLAEWQSGDELRRTRLVEISAGEIALIGDDDRFPRLTYDWLDVRRGLRAALPTTPDIWAQPAMYRVFDRRVADYIEGDILAPQRAGLERAAAAEQVKAAPLDLPPELQAALLEVLDKSADPDDLPRLVDVGLVVIATGEQGNKIARLTEAGAEVAQALAEAEQSAHQRDPFHAVHWPRRRFRCGGGPRSLAELHASGLRPLTAADRARIQREGYPAPAQPSGASVHGGTEADFEAWAATLDDRQRGVARAYRAAVARQIKGAAYGAVHFPKELQTIQADWLAAQPLPVEDPDRARRARLSTLNRQALLGLQVAPACPGRTAARRSSSRATAFQRAALTWIAEAQDDFSAWLTRMAALPRCEREPETVIEAAEQLADLFRAHCRVQAVNAAAKMLQISLPLWETLTADFAVQYRSACDHVREIAREHAWTQAQVPPGTARVTDAELAFIRALAGQAVEAGLGLEPTVFVLPPLGED